MGKILPQNLHRGYFILIFCSLYSALQRTEPVCSLVQTTAGSVHSAYLKELNTKKYLESKECPIYGALETYFLQTIRLLI